MYTMLAKGGPDIRDKTAISAILNNPVFDNFKNINVLPLIYDEKNLRCNILVFDFDKAKAEAARVTLMEAGAGKRKHPVYRFYDQQGDYICEVRYGGATANALQRGFWTHTKNAIKYFDSLTGGWIDYSLNTVLVKLFSHALLSTQKAHELVLEELRKDIEEQKLGIETNK
jgi:hypothetical protein